MRPADVLLLLFSHAAAMAFGCMAALLWLPPDVPSLLLGMAVGVLTLAIGLLALNLVRTAKRE